jgi:hypothetical protein
MRSNISNIHIKGKHLLLLVFVTATLLRGLPELLSGPYPVGYDLLAGYAPSVQALPETYPLRLFGWLWSSFSIFVLWFFWKISQLDLFTFLKIAAPVFYGLFSASFYYLLSKGVGWNNKKSFFTTLLFFLQPGILRLGWDQLRLMLGLVFLFLLLGLTKCDFVRGAQKRPAIFVSLSLLIIISQQLTATLFFVVVGWQLVRSFRERIPVLRALLLLSPSALIFSLQLYLDYFSTQVFSSHFIPLKLPSGSPLFAFTNYFLSDPRFINGNVLTVLAYVGNLSLYVVIPLIPLAVKGFFKEKVFLPILAWLLAASYSIAVFPWFAFSNYWWWIFLLPIPLTIYAGNALDKSGFTMKGKLSLRLIGGFFFDHQHRISSCLLLHATRACQIQRRLRVYSRNPRSYYLGKSTSSRKCSVDRSRKFHGFGSNLFTF